MKTLMTMLAVIALAGCKHDKDKEAPAPVQKAAEPAPADKAAAPLPAETRDQLKKAYETTSSAWASLTPEAKAGLGPSCKTALDAVNTAAKTTCGW